MSFILSVENKNGETLSSAVFIKCFNKLIYFFGAATAQGREKNSHTLLFDYVFKTYAGSYSTIEFGESEIPNSYFYIDLGALCAQNLTMRIMRVPSVLRSILSLRAKTVRKINSLLTSKN